MTQTARELLVAAYKLRHRVSQAIAEEEVGGLLGILELARLKIVAREPTVEMLMSKAAGDAWPSSPSGFWRAMWDAAP